MGIFLESTKKAFLDIVHHMIKQNKIEGLILDGTELPFILKKEDFKGFPLLNTTDIHVDSILEYALQN